MGVDGEGPGSSGRKGAVANGDARGRHDWAEPRLRCVFGEKFCCAIIAVFLETPPDLDEEGRGGWFG